MNKDIMVERFEPDGPELISYVKRVNVLMSKTEIAAQLAEECAELGHAVLKLRRTMMTGNPTPVSYDMAVEMVREEIADLILVLNTLDYKLGIIPDDEDIVRRNKAKAERWVQRLEGKA